MKNEVNVAELTAALNDFIQSSKNKTFTRQEIGEKLTGLGFNSQVVGIIIPKVFPFEKMGKSRLYELPKNPVYKGIIEGCYKIAREYKNSSRKASKRTVTKEVKTPVMNNFAEAKEINDAIHLLLSKGYKISRPLGLDVKQLLKDHPELSKTYMRYESI